MMVERKTVPLGETDGRRTDELLVGLDDFDLLHLRGCDGVLYRHRVSQVGIADGKYDSIVHRAVLQP